MEEKDIEKLKPIEQSMYYAGEKIEKMMDVYPCLLEGYIKNIEYGLYQKLFLELS